MKYETYFKLVLATGLRRGEACGLKWSDINWRKRTIHVQRGVVKLSHQESITKDPKTSSGDRMVYLSKEMCQLLKAWRKECEWDRQQTANETVDEDDYLFRQPNGKPMCPSTFTYRFKLILKANNLPLDLNVHSLRHTNASLLIAQGVDVRTVASLLGHAQASTTLDIYAHAFDKNKRKAQEKTWKGDWIMTRKIKLTRANKSILLKALAPYYYQEKALGHNTENPGRLILKIDSLPADKKLLFLQKKSASCESL